MTSRVSLPHVDALDGLRGAAVAGVLLYHGGHLKGGYLGVDLFFVLSGYLITSLLLAEWRDTERVSLGHFWARRARRLLPALVLVLLGVAIYCVAFADPAELNRIRGDALGTIGYVANWRAIFAHQSYFDLFLAPSPLQHTWSLAIEEQFYVLWPLIFVGLAAWWKRHTARAVLATALICGAASTLLMVTLYSSTNTNRAYYGTDTRAFALFAGIAIAAAVSIWGFPKDRLSRFMIEAMAIASLVVLTIMWTTLDGQAPRLYRGGFAVAGIAAALVIAAAAHPTRGPINKVLSLAPLCWLGLISYGLYLWHWPVDVVVTAGRTGITGWPLFGLRSAIAVALAVGSYYLVEMPIRRGALRPRQWRVAIPAISVVLVAVLLATTWTDTPATAGTKNLAHQNDDVVVIGDSLADSLAPGIEAQDVKVGVASSAGCRLIHGDLIATGLFSNNCGWETGWKAIIDYMDPKRVVLLAGIWDLFDVRPEGSTRFVAPGSPAWDRAFETQVDRLVSLAGARGAEVSILTLPCTRPSDGQPKVFGAGSDEIERVVAANAVIRRVAARHRAKPALIDLFTFLCPAGTFQSTVGGVSTRSDGVHLSDAGADLVARWLLPQIGLEPGPKSRQRAATSRPH